MARRSWLMVGLAFWTSGAFWGLPGVLFGQATQAAADVEEAPPIPPQQSKPWSPPSSKLPKTMIAAAKHLFRLGLGDPRGCEYREVVLWSRTSVLQGTDAPEETKCHAWVLPDSGAKPRYAIFWDGVVHPVAKVGEAADPRRDLLEEFAKEEKRRIDQAEQRGKWGTVLTGGEDNMYGPFISPRSVALLLRLGQVELAEKVWDQWRLGLGQEKAGAAEDPYLAIADDWTLDLYHQAWEAHQQAEDAQALMQERLLVRACEAIAAETSKRKLEPQAATHETRGTGLYQSLLGPAKAVLADQERRARERKHKTAPAVNICLAGNEFHFWEMLTDRLEQCPDKASRIALLIQHLEEVYQTPYVNVEEPVATMLIAEGEDAVEPLLKCLETDTRLTRYEPFDPQCGWRCDHMTEVRELVVPILDEILEMDFSSDRNSAPPRWDGQANSPDEWVPRLAKAIRTHWRQYRGLSRTERLYRMLANDQEPDGWLYAAERIVEDTKSSREKEDLNEPGPLPGAPRIPGAMAGESLRSKSGPSVTELMIRRSQWFGERDAKCAAKRQQLEDQISKLGDQLDEQKAQFEQQPADSTEPIPKSTSPQIQALQGKIDALKRRLDEDLDCAPVDHSSMLANACEMAIYLAAWDPPAAIPVMRTLTAECRLEILAHYGKDASPSKGQFHSYLAQFTLARAAAGDLQALDTYAEWICGVQPEDYGDSGADYTRLNGGGDLLLAPFWRYGSSFHCDGASKYLESAAERVFAFKRSPWNPSNRLTLEILDGEPDWLVGPLLTQYTFRRQVRKVLGEKREAGHALVHATDRIELKSNEGWHDTTTTVLDDSLCPAPGTKVTFRLCDLCAYRLSQLEGSPRCELFWPEKKRDEAVAACQKYLEMYGPSLRVPNEPFPTIQGPQTLGSVPFSKHPRDPRVRLTFDVWGHIVDGKIPAKAPWQLATAVWTKCQDAPYLREDFDAGQVTKTLAYEQRGTVWQIEISGQGRRLYQFVGRHSIAKVPAEEIEFPWEMGLKEPLGPTLEGALVFRSPEALKKGPASSLPPVFRLGSPITYKLQIHNRAGLAHPLPPLREIGADGSAPADGFGYSVELKYVPYNFSSSRVRGLPPPPWEKDLTQLPWKPVPRKTGSPIVLKAQVTHLDPNEVREVAVLDLAQQFEMTRAGTYSLRLRFTEAGKRIASTADFDSLDLSLLVVHPPAAAKASPSAAR